MAKILVTGAHGQLGKCIQDRTDQLPDDEFVFIDIDDLDIGKFDEVSNFLQNTNPDYLINCAAYTNVDGAENQKELAYLLNDQAVGHLAQICKQTNTKLFHISTDYIFDSTTPIPLKEEDAVNPHSVYGKSKFQGEQAIKNSGASAIIIRTSWLYSEHNHNFFKTVLKHCKNSGKMRIVYDQVGTPTYAGDLADVILSLIHHPATKKQDILHYSNEGVCSWYDFAIAIKQIQGISCDILPIRTEEYPLPAPRPLYSVLDKTKIRKEYSIEIPHWTDSLRSCIDKYNELERST